MVEFFKNIYDTSRERLRNPILGAFLFAVITINWKGFASLFFSDLPVEDRVTRIENLYGFTWDKFWWVIGVTLLYIVVLPYLMWGLEKVTYLATKGRKKGRTKNTVDDLDGRILIARKENELEILKAKLKDVSELNEEIKKLVKEKNRLINENEDNKEQYKGLVYEMHRFLEQNPESHVSKRLFDYLALTPVLIQEEKERNVNTLGLQEVVNEVNKKVLVKTNKTVGKYLSTDNQNIIDPDAVIEKFLEIKKGFFYKYFRVIHDSIGNGISDLYHVKQEILDYYIDQGIIEGVKKDKGTNRILYILTEMGTEFSSYYSKEDFISSN